KVTYEEKMKLDIKLEGESAQYADMIPKERTEKKLLYFTPEVSVYQGEKGKQQPETVEQEEGGPMVQIRIEQSEDKVYRDLKANKKIEQRDFMTRLFLIESDAGNTDWKMTGEQKTILNFPCQAASTVKNGDTIRVWFTSAIPVPTGPRNFGNLPGLILSVDVNNGNQTLTATSVEFMTPDKSLMQKPKEGKKVTAEQFKKIVDEKMKEMGAEGEGNGANVVIKINR
ncbi:MAG TPA: GLPGLI family protein, partial [Bacteroidales bacterium]|nr:GLPGLI family protein [Bacteroidales bacterium]